MLINKITLSDFKNFKGIHEFTFNKLNLISGENGAGKSTIALHSLLFALFGYSEVKLSELPTRNYKGANTYVQVDLDYLGNNYIITRTIPTAVSIKLNGFDLTFANNQLKQAELDRLFRGVDYFRKFRMIDIKDSINILEDGQAGLRKTLVSFNDYEAISKIRGRLQIKKHERALLNKDQAVVYTHAPSEKRYEALGIKLLNVTENLNVLEKEIQDNEAHLNTIVYKRNRINDNKINLVKNRDSIMVDSACPTCKQTLPTATKHDLLNDIAQQLKDSSTLLQQIIDDCTSQGEVVTYLKSNKKSLIDKHTKLTRFRLRLETRLKQKQYVWTTQDVLVIKKAIEELDTFSTFYLTEKLKTLEPLINDVVSKIGFKVRFDITDKGNFDIILDNNGVEYKYKDLSNGQRLLVTTAFQLALLMEKGDNGLIIADEGFSSLSDKNLSLIIDLFKNSNFQLLFVVHRYTTTDNEIKSICLK